MKAWVEPDVRDAVMDYVQYWSDRTALPTTRLVSWLGIGRSKYYDWKRRYGKVNEHNAWVPRDFWLEEWERQAIEAHHCAHPLDGYRRLTYMMLDADIVAVSPSSVYRVLKEAGLMERWNRKPSKKGQGFEQPLKPHEHWHIDICHINIGGTFFYLCRKKFPDARPRIISDNGPQFIAKDFKEFIRLCGMTHVRTSPYYPQSNGKLERYHKTLKGCCIRPHTPESLEEARRSVSTFVQHYNTERLHSAIGYVTPRDKLAGKEKEIWATRESRLAAAREARQARRQTAQQANAGAVATLTSLVSGATVTVSGETEVGSAGAQPAEG